MSTDVVIQIDALLGDLASGEFRAKIPYTYRAPENVERGLRACTLGRHSHDLYLI